LSDLLRKFFYKASERLSLRSRLLLLLLLLVVVLQDAARMLPAHACDGSTVLVEFVISFVAGRRPAALLPALSVCPSCVRLTTAENVKQLPLPQQDDRNSTFYSVAQKTERVFPAPSLFLHAPHAYCRPRV